MFKKVRTVKEKILIAFFIYSTISFLVSVTSFLLFRRMDKVEQATIKVNNIYNQTLDAIQSGQEFLVYDANNGEYYRTSGSDALELHNEKIVDIIDQKLDSTKLASSNYDVEMLNSLDSIRSLLNTYRVTFNTLVQLVTQKGFKDYGIIGEMRSNIHQIEEEERVNQEIVLKIRRNEKDYLLRNEKQYFENIHQLVFQLRGLIRDNRDIPITQRNRLQRSLSSYYTNILKLSAINLDLGLGENKGLRIELKLQIASITQLVGEINTKAKDTKASLMTRIEVTLVSIVTFSVILTLFLSISFKFILEEDRMAEETNLPNQD